MRKIINKMLWFSSLLLCNACLEEELLIAKADFTLTEINIANGKKVIFNNLSQNAEKFSWTFQNGSPNNSDKYNPGEVLFTTSGSHEIKLTVSNKDGSSSEKVKQITIN